MAQQTAVEWLVNKIYMVIPNEERNFLEGLRDEAKAMDKQQKIDAYMHGQNNGYMYRDGVGNIIDGEQYYNETYNK